jgi:hypothetical protein
VVRLVLQATGEQTAALVADGLAVLIDADDPGPVRAGALGERTRQRQTAFLAFVQLAVPALRELDHRVADDALDAVAVLVGAVEDEQLEVDADLVRGQADALGGVHRRDHVRDQLVQLVAELGDGLVQPVHDILAPPRDGQHRTVRRQRRHARNPSEASRRPHACVRRTGGQDLRFFGRKGLPQRGWVRTG